jgi:hypothetical protein
MPKRNAGWNATKRLLTDFSQKAFLGLPVQCSTAEGRRSEKGSAV